MATNLPYVLVHGAGLGGWCWRRVKDRMESRGAKVFTPTLQGLGATSFCPQHPPTLRTHIENVAELITTEELENVVLVGHSYGGMVILVWLTN